MSEEGNMHYSEKYIQRIIEKVNTIHRTWDNRFIEYWVRREISPIINDIMGETMDKTKEMALNMAKRLAEEGKSS